MKANRGLVAQGANTSRMEDKKKNEKKTGKKTTRKEKKSQRVKFDKEKTFKMLETKMSLSKEEITRNYEEFMALCPSGEMTKAKFMEDQGGLLAESLFRVFDEDNSGKLDFTEYMLASNCTNLSQPEEKLNWIFNVFDEDGGGFIDRKEIEKIVVSLFRMAGSEVEQEVIHACAKNIEEAVDEDGDGEISKEEFIENAMKIGFIQNILAINAEDM